LAQGICLHNKTNRKHTHKSFSLELSDSIMMFFTAFLAGAMATLELTPKNFDEVVHESGKGTFIKFLAPW